MAVKMKPCSSAKAPPMYVSLARNAGSSAALKGGPPGTPMPAARSPLFAISVPQAPTPGSSPITTAGAWLRGVAWNACAAMTMPIQSTIAIPASIGTAHAMCDTVPMRHITVKNTPFSIE